MSRQSLSVIAVTTLLFLSGCTSSAAPVGDTDGPVITVARLDDVSEDPAELASTADPDATTMQPSEPTPTETEPLPPLKPISFVQYGGSLSCPDGELRTGFLYWSNDRRLPLPSEAGSAEGFDALLTQTQPGGFFSYSDIPHLGTSRVSPVARVPLGVGDGRVFVEELSGTTVLETSIDYGDQTCSFEANRYTSFAAYHGSFECSRLGTVDSFLLAEQGSGGKVFLGWRPPTGSDFIQTILNDGVGEFKTWGVSDGSLGSNVLIDFSFSAEEADRRTNLAGTGQLVDQEGAEPQPCTGNWTSWTEPADEEAVTSARPSNDDASVGDLRYEHDSNTRVWASRIAVIDGDTIYEMPPGVIIEHGSATDRDQISVEMEWEAEDGAWITVIFYTRHDGEQWWSYEVRTWVDQDGRDDEWVYYPGDNDTFFHGRESGSYFASPLGVAYEGELVLDTLVVEDLRFEAFGAEFPVDAANDLGQRPARNPVLEQATEYRFESEYAVIDADSFVLVVDGESVAPNGDLEGSNSGGYVGDSGRQETNFRWKDQNNQFTHSLMFEFRSDGADWWISRVDVSQGDERVDVRELVLAKTPLGDVFEGDLIVGNLELRGARIHLVGCTDEPGLRMQGQCPYGE